MPTIELFGIIAEVPEGHPDFRGADFRLPGLPNTGPDFAYVPIESLFGVWRITQIHKAYQQRRVVDAARIYWIDKAVEQLRSHIDSWPGEEQVIGNIDAKKRHIDYWQQAETWLRIGEKAKEEASG